MVTCSITTSVLGCLVTSFLFFRYVIFLDISLVQKSIIFALFVLMGCIPLLVSYSLENVFGAAYPIYRYALYFIFIGCIILFALTIFRDAIWMIGCKTGFLPAISKIGYYKVDLITIVLSLLMTTWALYEGIKTPDLKITNLLSDKIKQEQTIAVLSDLHIHRVINPNKIKEIVERTNEQKPDVILLAGDIIDDDVDQVSEITALLKNLKAKNGIYFVTGNHEFYAGYKETVDELKKLGFIFLENNGQLINEQLYIAGIPDLFSSTSHGINIDINKAFAESNSSKYNLLMSHTPADFAQNNNFDLQVSGHTHGGQIFPFHIFAKLHNKYLAGIYDLDNKAKIYVSRGAGQWGPQMRFLAPSEISIIKLTPTTKANEMKKSDVDSIFLQGEINPYGQYFTGQTYLNMLSTKDNIWNTPIGNVTFEPGARTNWHKHSGGQILLVTGGEGRYQEKGQAIQTLHKGDIVKIAPNIEHWHGAAPDSWFVHVSIESNGADNKVSWFSPVTNKEYK